MDTYYPAFICCSALVGLSAMPGAERWLARLEVRRAGLAACGLLYGLALWLYFLHPEWPTPVWGMGVTALAVAGAVRQVAWPRRLRAVSIGLLVGWSALRLWTEHPFLLWHGLPTVWLLSAASGLGLLGAADRPRERVLSLAGLALGVLTGRWLDGGPSAPWSADVAGMAPACNVVWLTALMVLLWSAFGTGGRRAAEGRPRPSI
ncbi:hypothetical protein [Alicyclobacillus sp.]|uniref:hypothetical protein n=1 Tax=Alicyclobacillus sp. TaxID=61169 RepID=UPI0025C6A3F8|nr:hypothetical protein [Alicyclobacillus sp.]MCL6515582.1 hypothetical protein [Alicyclobacillus sp.]